VKIWVPVIKFRTVQVGRQLSSAQARRRRRQRLAGLIILIFVASAVAVKLFGGPAEGTISKNPKVIKFDNAAKVTNGAYDGQYFYITYPSSLQPNASAKSAPYLNVVNLFSTQHTSEHVAIALVREELSRDSGLNYRQQHPELYSPVAGSDGLVFSKTQAGFEKTGFFSHDGLVLSISLTASGAQDVGGDYDSIAKSLIWKQ
jgi:hypothetical protein